jgi:hypothetical protein
MVGETEPLDQIKMLVDRQDAEATLHWTRNNYFLVGLSFLVVAYGLSLQSSNATIDWFHALIIFLGITLNVAWMLIQFRSDQYIGYYKSKIAALCNEHKVENPFPAGLRGYQTRKVAYVLPGVFLAFWLGLACVLVISH